MTDVRTAWNRIVAWCHEYAPTTAREMTDPSADAEIAAAEKAIGERFPDDLRDFFRCVGSITDISSGAVLPPAHAPLSLADSLRTRKMMIDIRGEPGDWLAETGPIAGTGGDTWSLRWIPIGEDNCGTTLFVDLREGAQRGCVMDFDKVEACSEPPQWPGVAAMLAEIAEALERNTVVLGNRPSVEPDGRLFWDAPSGLWVDGFPLHDHNLRRRLQGFVDHVRADPNAELAAARVARVVDALIVTAESLENGTPARYDDPDPRDERALVAYAAEHGGRTGLVDRVQSLGTRLIDLASPHADGVDWVRGKPPLIPAKVRESGEVVVDAEVSWPGLVAGLGWYLYERASLD
ncbi:SMI1/KNR4 family protein [Saccharopolyspora sp. 5N102]|uniref:SMI1/KNR4 family protein n=1 Tax=Saccharopolyspora sp. 5N102 TaxID=3375155 RepID=UPI003795E1CE